MEVAITTCTDCWISPDSSSDGSPPDRAGVVGASPHPSCSLQGPGAPRLRGLYPPRLRRREGQAQTQVQEDAPRADPEGKEGKVRHISQLLVNQFPTDIASVHLVMGCPSARADVKVVKKKNPYSNLEQPKFWPHHQNSTSGVAVGVVALVVPILAGKS